MKINLLAFALLSGVLKVKSSVDGSILPRAFKVAATLPALIVAVTAPDVPAVRAFTSAALALSVRFYISSPSVVIPFAA